MTNNLYRSFCIAFLFTGLLALPFFSFSQQQEEPKRVTIVVTAKEVSSQKEILQLPADNVPKVVSGKSKEITIGKKPTTTLAKSAIIPANASKGAAVVKASTNKALVAVGTKEITSVKKPEVVKAKPEVKQEPQPVHAVEEKTVSIPKAETTAPDVTRSEQAKQINDKTAASIKSETPVKEEIKVSQGARANSISYIWIGIFLIVAGLVLGLLFGKPAFLISAVGAVFIALGLII